MRVLAGLTGTLSLTLALLVPLPFWVEKAGPPWRVELAKKYVGSDYVVVDHGLYAINPESRATASLIGLFSQKTNMVYEHYVFAGCWGKLRFLSPSNPGDLAILEEARFAAVGDLRYERFKTNYEEQCSPLAFADKLHGLGLQLKRWTQ